MSQQNAKSTEFSCHAPDAAAVFLSGTFNDWDTEAAAMTKDDQGNWRSKLELPPGHHEFKFVVDGQWCCEPGCHPSVECPQCVPNACGTMNRFVDVA